MHMLCRPLLQVLAKAADALSAGDLVNRKVRQYGSWGLMPFAAAIGSVYPAAYMRGSRETYHPMETNWPRCAALQPNAPCSCPLQLPAGRPIHTR